MEKLRFLGMILRNSTYMKVVTTVFGLTVFLRREILPSSVSERLKLINLFSLMSWRTWGIILLSFLLITFFGGVLSWRRKQVQPLLGEVGSL